MNLRDELLKVRERYGRLTPETVVEAARPDDHPLHGHVFDRDVSGAADAWYRHRAHELIQSVRVVYREPAEGEPARSVRAFVAVPRDDRSGSYIYEPTSEIVKDDFTTRLVLQQMEREWKTLYSKYEGFEEFVLMVRDSFNDEEDAA